MDTDDLFERSLILHREKRGKIEIRSRMRLETQDDLSLAYTPGVARPCQEIARDETAAWELTWRGRTVAVVSDGSAVLGLGDIGPTAALPVMEGKAVLFHELGGVNAVPIVIDAKTPDDIVHIVKSIAPTFGGINLEDISAPRCFEVEERLQDIGIPVLHDDQHGTAIVLLAAMVNGSKVLGRRLGDLSVVINGAGAAGRAIAFLLSCRDEDADRCIPVGQIRVCDSKGIIWAGRPGNDAVKDEIGQVSNREGQQGTLKDAMKGADVFIGVSRANLLTTEDVASMAKDSIVLAMANPIPEIMPDDALAGGAAIVGTGRSDFPNQVNNVLAFPGLFRGALEARARCFTSSMKLAAMESIAGCGDEPTLKRILPSPFNRSVAQKVAHAVSEAARNAGVAR
jgi:malate dehydrogenase (oxaloacetate-decarboxylating)